LHCIILNYKHLGAFSFKNNVVNCKQREIRKKQHKACQLILLKSMMEFQFFPALISWLYVLGRVVHTIDMRNKSAHTFYGPGGGKY
jgi:hypothetical protein